MNDVQSLKENRGYGQRGNVSVLFLKEVSAVIELLTTSNYKHLQYRNGKTGNGSVLINNSNLSLLNHRPAVIWKILALRVLSVMRNVAMRLIRGRFLVFLCDFPVFLRVWWVISGHRVFLTFTGQSIPQHKVRHVVSRFQLNTWNRSEEMKARASVCIMTNSSWKFVQNLQFTRWHLKLL